MYEFDYFDFHSVIVPIGYQRFECPICNFTCSNERDFDQHAFEDHKVEKIKTLDNGFLVF